MNKKAIQRPAGERAVNRVLFTPAEDRFIEAMAKDGWFAVRIAKALNRNPSSIRERSIKLGVKFEVGRRMFTDAEREIIIARRSEGVSFCRIGDELDRCTNTIQRYVQRIGIGGNMKGSENG